MFVLGICKRFSWRFASTIRQSVVNNGTSWKSCPKIRYKHTTVNSLSYFHCPDNLPLVSANLGQLLDWATDSYQEREVIVDCHRGVRKTFGQFNKDVKNLAAGFVSLDLKVGDRIGLWSSNRYEWLVAQMATSKAGLILVPLNPAYQLPELEYCVETMQISAMVTERYFKDQDYYRMMTEMVPEISTTKIGERIKSKRHPYLKSLIVIDEEDLTGAHKYEDVIQRCGNDEMKQLFYIQKRLDPDSTAYVMFTSGTTGTPKGAILAHHGLVNVALLSTKRNGYDKQMWRMLCCPLLFHALGSVILVLNAIASGSCIVLPSPGFSPKLSLKAVENERCNLLCGTPTMFFDLLNHPEEPATDMSSITRIKMAGSHCPPTLLTQIRQKWNCEVVCAYGMTELSGLVAGNRPRSSSQQALQSVGTVYEHLQMKIVDKQNAIVPRGVAGEICVRGYRVMKGYWNNVQKTKEAIRDDGWYHSGDVGIMLEDDTIQIVDRTTDMIIRGGENIYPKEIEDFLIGHPKISEAYVIGVPSERLGEEVCVWIKCKPQQMLSHAQVENYCKGKISMAKIPRYIRFVDEFPKTLSGKIRKNVMKLEEIKFQGEKSTT